MDWFTADLHLYDADVLVRENRPYGCREEFVEDIINKFNSQVSKGDTIYCIGDFVGYNKNLKGDWVSALSSVTRFNCNVVLIIGNNEERVIDKHFNGFEDFKSYCISKGFKDVVYNMHLAMRNKEFYLVHYPIECKKGYISLFGHTHRATGLWKPFGLNVGCDLNHFYLFSEDEVFRLLHDKEVYWDVDENIYSLGIGN